MHDREAQNRKYRERLFETASEQGGYFTTAQAQACGYSRALLAHHAKSGRFIRIRQGLYRFREYPTSPREDVIAEWLAAGRETAVVSHESALDLLGLSDVVPEVVHLTVPRSKRYCTGTVGVAIHTTTRRTDKSDVLVREGIRLTGPVRSIVANASMTSSLLGVLGPCCRLCDRVRGLRPSPPLGAPSHRMG